MAAAATTSAATNGNDSNGSAAANYAAAGGAADTFRATATCASAATGTWCDAAKGDASRTTAAHE